MTLRTLVFSAVAALALALAAIAGAKTVHDGNDTTGPIDIKQAGSSKVKHGKITFVATFFEDVPPDGNTGNEYIEIWKKKPHKLRGCGGCFREGPYKMQGPQTGKRDVFKGGEAGTPYKKTGSGRIKRKGNRLTFIVPLKAIGKPKHKIFWRVQSSYYGPQSECPTFDACSDSAPNGSKLVKQKL